MRYKIVMYLRRLKSSSSRSEVRNEKKTSIEFILMALFCGKKILINNRLYLVNFYNVFSFLSSLLFLLWKPQTQRFGTLCNIDMPQLFRIILSHFLLLYIHRTLDKHTMTGASPTIYKIFTE